MMDSKKKYDIFVSYSPKDRPWVSEFVSALLEEGITVFFDVQALTPGERWKESIQEALRQSRTLIVILSPNSVESPWTFFELGAAFADQKKIIPILVQDMDERSISLPLIRSYQFLKESSPSKAGKLISEVLGRREIEKD